MQLTAYPLNGAGYGQFGESFVYRRISDESVAPCDSIGWNYECSPMINQALNSPSEVEESLQEFTGSACLRPNGTSGARLQAAGGFTGWSSPRKCKVEVPMIMWLLRYTSQRRAAELLKNDT
jgi:hypothetical protein